MELTFLGATGTVTGSRYLVADGREKLLVDCGLFQGLKELRLRNREPVPFGPAEIGTILLTHAHLDHTGYLPLLVDQGFRGPVHCSPATAELCGILLPDSGHLQEEEADRANRHGYSKHSPALPLYTRADAERALEQLEPVPMERPADAGAFRFELRRAGHILGSASITLEHDGASVLFSGDLGRPHHPILRPPEPGPGADYVVIESTYGDRRHEAEDTEEALARIINRTAHRGGVVVIPSFAVGRTQTVLYHIERLRDRGDIPALPIFIDSPMAIDATGILLRHREELRLNAAECAELRSGARLANSAEESKAIDRHAGPMIILSASGMATGGRVLFHLARFAPEQRNTILLVGYQAVGTRGADLEAGAAHLRIHGVDVPVRAEVAVLHGLSAHADSDELVRWLAALGRPPRTVFVTHGEPGPAEALRARIQRELGWTARVPAYGEHVRLDGSRPGPAATAPLSHPA